MTTKPLLILAALLAAVAAGLAAPPALADCVSDATVSYVGSDWGPVPMWRVSVPLMNTTWDVQAADADAARAAVAPLISCPAPPAPAAPAPATPPPATTAPTPPASAPATGQPAAPPSDLASGQAAQIVMQADVTLVGNSWGPLPIWRVYVPSRNATYDVAAATADDARNAVLQTIAYAIDQNPNVAPAAPSAPSAQAPAVAGASGGAPVTVTADVVAPAPAVAVNTPAKSKTAKRGVHHAPATSKTR